MQTSSPLSRGQRLIAIARGSIEHALGLGARVFVPLDDWLTQPAASFVTLTQDGALRGCIGSLEAHRALVEDVVANARAAAFHDPRFAPLTAREWPSVKVEVSVLTPMQPLPCRDEADLLAKLRPDLDGIAIEFGEHRATFLPQVWENLPAPSLFLRELKRKARLPESFWHPDIRVHRYGVEKFTEEVKP
ncbi:MAG TPA: AmmeMemoRadiSam system protein A [Usitatibacteraceae bacterium]|nr:AmmeMemoRadiSam system protein A [Usitatibacteraceae bacterium]